MKDIVVIPTYNEADNIVPLVEAIHSVCPAVDVLVVDDGSPDGTGLVAAGLDGVQVLQRSGKLGLGTAYVAGYTRAIEVGYDRIAGMDADFSHDPEVLPDLFAATEEHDVAIGSRYIPGGGTRNWGLHRQVLSRTANGVARIMLRMPAHDVTSGYRCYRREVLEAIELDTLKSEGYSFLVELLYRCVSKGFTVAEVPIIFEERRAGASKLDRAEIWKGVANLFRLRFGIRT